MEDVGKKTEEKFLTVNIEELNIYFGESNSNYYGSQDFSLDSEEDTADDSGKVNDSDKVNDFGKDDDSDSDISDDAVEEYLNEIFGMLKPCHKPCNSTDGEKNSTDEEWIVKIARKNHEQGWKGGCHEKE